MLTCTAAFLILAQVKAKPFNPVGSWQPRLTLVEANVERGTPEAVKQMLRDSVKEQNDKPEILVLAKDHTYRLPRERGTWNLAGLKLTLNVTRRGKMKVNGERRSYTIAQDGKSFSAAINDLVQVRYTRSR